MYNFSAPYQMFQNLIGGHFIVAQDVTDALLGAGHNRVVCTINDDFTMQCALISTGNGTHYIMLNKTHAKKIGVREGDMMQIQLAPDTSQYGAPMPEELSALLEIDDVFDAAFHALTAGKQRTLIHAVIAVKNTDARLSRALIICDYIKAGGSKIDQMTINELIKARR
jgi:Domain of unknown function (DUF1905)/Bacteriocin-protection, YdeI or OmpD-Associated